MCIKINKIIEKFKENNYFIFKLFLSVFLLYIVFYSSIIRTNENYGKDLSMQIHFIENIQTTEFTNMFLPSLFRTIISTNNYIYDLSPFSQIFSVIFLTLSGLILLYIFSSNKGNYVFKIIPALIIGVNPAFLECISSKYNAIYYGMSIFFSLLPLLFYKEKNITYFIITIFSLVLSFCLCHAASGVYFVLIIFLSLQMYLNNEDGKNIIRLLCKNFLSYLLALIIFFVLLNVVNNNEITKGVYVFNKFSDYFINLLKMYKVILNVDFIYLWSSIVLIMIVAVIVAVTINSIRNKIISFFVVISSLLLVLLFQFGIIPIVVPDCLNTGKFCLGYGVTLSILFIFFIEFINKLKILLIIPLLLTWFFGVYSIHYGNILGMQKNYNNTRLLALVTDLDNMPLMKDSKIINIYFSNKHDIYSPVVLNASKKYKGILKLIPTFLKDPNYIKLYYYRNNINICESNFYTDNDLELYLDTNFHKIETNNRDYIKVTLYGIND